MQTLIPNLGPRAKIYLFFGVIAGGLPTLGIVQRFHPVQAALISAIALAILSFSSTQITHPILWWFSTGALGGIIIGAAAVLEETFAETDYPMEFHIRVAFLLLQGLSGFLSGAILSRKPHNARVPTIKEFLSRSSALTAGLFAIVVTTSFLREGLEVARTLSSRLSATTTILVTALVIPGIAGYLLFEREPAIAAKQFDP